jgi:uncharacterized protein YkwD
MEMPIPRNVRWFLVSAVAGYGGFLLFLAVAVALSFQPLLAVEAKGTRDQPADGQAGTKEREVSRMEVGILDYTNEERRSRGLAPLRPSPALASLARKHSSHMCSSGTLAHDSESFPAGWRTFAQRMDRVRVGSAAENVAYHSLLKTPEQWAKAVTNVWMKSPNHRKNMLNPTFRYMGVGIVRCKNAIAYATQILVAEPGRNSGNSMR